MLIFRLVIVAAVLLGIWGVRQLARAHGIGPLAWRWLTGMPHHGEHLTDAGWRAPGTRALTPTGRVSRFWYRPRLHRARRRILHTVAGVGTAWGLIFHRTATLIVLALAAAAGAAYGVVAALAWHRQRKHHLTWVYPAHLTAAPLAGHPVAMAPEDWLSIEPDRSRVRAILPPEFNQDAKGRQRLAETLASKLAIESPEVSYRLAGPAPMLELTQSQPPPPLVTLADVRAAIEAAKPDEPVWGLGRRRKVVKTSLSGDSPHLGLSMGSGGGKSETAKSLLAQLLFHGAAGLVLDFKMMSHLWARGLPNVVLAVRVAEIHRALVWLGAEVGRRKEVAYHGADDDGRVHADVGVRLVVVLEELNATVAALRAWWRDNGDGGRSPALTALDEVSFTGRSVLVNLVYIGQRLSDRATGGGGDARENIGVIAFARYRPSTWKMLAPDFPMPPKNNTPGRLQIVSDQVQETQGILMTTAEARELALSGVVSPLPSGMPGARRATGEPVSGALALVSAPDLGVEQFQPGISPAPVSGPVTLREAVGEGLLGPLTLAGARTARHRDETFPAPVGRRVLADEFDPEALASWAASRRE